MRGHREPIVINGAHGEGGGALLRTALAMAALTQQPVRLHGIRGAMRKPGLNSEDLTVVAALAASCRADVKGDDLESKELHFEPTTSPRPLESKFDVGVFEKGFVPGGGPVILESLLPVLIRAGAYSHLTVAAETHGQNTLGYDSFERVSLAAHRAQGVYAFPSVSWASFGSGAKGEMTLEIEPSVPLPLQWKDRGELVSCHGQVSYSDVSPDIAERGVKHIRSIFESRGHEAEVDAVPFRSRGSGISVTVWAEFERGLGSGTMNGQRGVKMEAVVDSAFRAFDEWFTSDATVDSYLADQLLLIAAQGDGKSVFTTPRVTRRLVTMSWVIKQFMPVHITIKGEEGYPGTVTVER